MCVNDLWLSNRASFFLVVVLGGVGVDSTPGYYRLLVVYEYKYIRTSEYVHADSLFEEET